MIYLSGGVNAMLERQQWAGFLLTPYMGNRPDLAASQWAADTGCFTHADTFSIDQYLAYLMTRRPYRSTCVFANAPDVVHTYEDGRIVGDPVATWERSRPILPIIRKMGYKAALVAQPGMEDAPIHWRAFDVLFLGGDTAWKLSRAAHDLTQRAIANGKHVHMGRVNSFSRLQKAHTWGCASADGTYTCFGPKKNTPRLLAWLREINGQPSLWGGLAAVPDSRERTA